MTSSVKKDKQSSSRRKPGSIVRSSRWTPAFAGVTVFLLFSSAVFAQSETVTLCRLRAAHQPDENVSYKPGVDVYGNPVTPADFDAPFSIPDRISVPLTIDLAQRLNQNLPDGMLLEAEFGVIDIYEDGRVLYDGRDLTAAAVAVCGEEPLPVIEPEIIYVPPPAPAPAPAESAEEIIWGEGH